MLRGGYRRGRLQRLKHLLLQQQQQQQQQEEPISRRIRVLGTLATITAGKQQRSSLSYVLSHQQPPHEDFQHHRHQQQQQQQLFSQQFPTASSSASFSSVALESSQYDELDNDNNNNNNSNKVFELDSSTGIVYEVISDKQNKKEQQQRPMYQVIVGLEIHAQLDIPTKLFSSAPSTTASSSSHHHQQQPNACVHPFDAAVPGSLPSAVSAEAATKAVLAAAALHCQQIHNTSRFERKHYAYGDLPTSYQITQQRWPLAQNGVISIQRPTLHSNSKKKKKKPQKKNDNDTTAVDDDDLIICRIERIQIEQDTGKTTTTTTTQSKSFSRIDLNRAGCALIEIVTHPDLRSSGDAAAVVRHVRQLLRHMGVCGGKMELGQLRVDVNVNLEEIIENNNNKNDGPQQKRSPRVEVKNVNSIQQVAAAIDFEAVRQAREWNDNTLGEETRTWKVVPPRTELIRRKDGQEDYRFLPEPDIPPLVLKESLFVSSELNTDSDSSSSFQTLLNDFLQRRLPESPAAAMERLQTTYGISPYQAQTIAGDPPAIAFFDQMMKVSTAKINDSVLFAKEAANLLVNDLFGLVKESGQAAASAAAELDDPDHPHDEDEASVKDSKITPNQLAKIAILILNGSISSPIKKQLFLHLQEEQYLGRDPEELVIELGLELVTDPTKLRMICRQVIHDHPEQFQLYQKGGKFIVKIQKMFIGKAMVASHGTAHPERLQEVLEDVLNELTTAAAAAADKNKET